MEMAQQKGDKQGQGNWEQDLEDLGRAVGSEVRSLVNELGRTLGPAVRDVSAGVGEGLRGAAQGLGQAARRDGSFPWAADPGSYSVLRSQDHHTFTRKGSFLYLELL